MELRDTTTRETRYHFGEFGLYVSWVLWLVVGIAIGALFSWILIFNTKLDRSKELQFYRGSYEMCYAFGMAAQIPPLEIIKACRDEVNNAILVDAYRSKNNNANWSNGDWLRLPE